MPRLATGGRGGRIELRNLGHRGHQTPGVIMRGSCENLVCASRLDNLSLVKNRNSIADPGHRGQVVGDVENGHPRASVQLTKQLENF